VEIRIGSFLPVSLVGGGKFCLLAVVFVIKEMSEVLKGVPKSREIKIRRDKKKEKIFMVDLTEVKLSL